MSPIEVGALTTAFLGALYALLAVITIGHDGAIGDVLVGVFISVAGMVTAIAARCWESR